MTKGNTMFEPQEKKDTDPDASQKVKEAARKAAEKIADPKLRKEIVGKLSEATSTTGDKTAPEIKKEGQANFDAWLKEQKELRAKQAAEKAQPSAAERDKLLQRMRDATSTVPTNNTVGDSLRKAADGTSPEASSALKAQQALIEAAQKKRAEEKAAEGTKKQ